MARKSKEYPVNQERIEKQKEMVVDQLKKTPVVEVACQKVGVGRTTFYRWRHEDVEFDSSCLDALSSGIDLVNDLAESKLIGQIKDSSLPAIAFWLRNRHKAYTNKLKVESTVTVKQPELSDKDAASVEDMLKQMGTRQQSIRNSKKPYVIESKKQPTDEEKEAGGADTAEPTCPPETGKEQP